jgi:hypothetical protein
MKKILALTLILGIFGALVAGCSGGGDNAEGGTAGSTASTGGDAKAPETE